MTHSPRHPRRAFVTALAVTMIALVAVALAAITAHLSTTARQAAHLRDRAQAEELLLAAQTATRQNPTLRTLSLPATLQDSNAFVTITPTPTNQLRLEATVHQTHLTLD